MNSDEFDRWFDPWESLYNGNGDYYFLFFTMASNSIRLVFHLPLLKAA